MDVEHGLLRTRNGYDDGNYVNYQIMKIMSRKIIDHLEWYLPMHRKSRYVTRKGDRYTSLRDTTALESPKYSTLALVRGGGVERTPMIFREKLA